jgi:hypothetical protein
MSTAFHPATTGDYFLASLEAMMLANGQGRHFASTVVRLKSMPDLAALRCAWEVLHREHDVLGARLHRQLRGWRLGWKVAEPAQAPAIAVHQSIALDDDIIRQRLRGYLGSEPIRAPLTLELFAPATLLLTWRHGILDGVGINLLLDQLARGDVGKADAVTALPARSPRALYQLARPALDVLTNVTNTSNESAWDRRRPMVGVPGFQVIEFSREQSVQIGAQVRRHCGEVFHMPAFAAVAARGLRLLHEMRQNPQANIHLQIPFQARKRAAGAVFQNRMGTLMLPLEAKELGTFESAVKHVLAVYKDMLKRNMPQASEALAQLTMGIPVRLAMSFVRFQNKGEICSLFHSHTGTFLRGVDCFAGAEVENVYTVPSVSTPPGFGLFFSDHREALTATIAWRGESLNEAEVQAVIEQTKHDLLGP